VKKIAVFFSSSNPLGYPLNKKDYLTAYRELSEEVTALGAEFYVVRGQDSYLGEGSFSNSWQFDGEHVRESGAVVIDALYDKGSFVPDDSLPTLNSRAVNEICTDKWKTYQAFPEFCPRTILVSASCWMNQIVGVVGVRWGSV
jgi:hypothetical protein